MAIDNNPARPLVGSWYEDTQERIFEAVAYDEDTDLVEVQYFDGTVSELELGKWRQSTVTEAAPPEDFSGVFGGLTEDDLSDTERRRRAADSRRIWDVLNGGT